MAAALQKVKDTLGPEALVLSTRTLGKKGLGVLGRQTVEITAALESPAMRSSSKVAAKKPERPQQQTAQHTAMGRSAVSNRVETLDDDVVKLSRKAPAPETPAAAPVPETPAAPAPSVTAAPAPQSRQLEDEVKQLRAQLESQSFNQLRNEIEQLKELMNQLAKAQSEMRSAPAPQTVAAVAPAAGAQLSPVKPRNRSTEDSSLAGLMTILQERGIDPDAAATIAGYAAPRMTQKQRNDPDMKRAFLSNTLAGLVQSCEPLWSPGEPQKKVALIGATGVGKTTTIAKLAARAVTESGARVALVTIDTYRIAAVEQLKVYGEIMGISVDVVTSPDQLQEIFRKHRDKDLILIDTAGRSPKDSVRIDELNSFLGRHSGVENYLVLAAPTDDHLQQKSFDLFSRLPLTGLIFTKLDEADQCGSLINLPLRNNIDIGCLTNGQRVPEDLFAAEPHMVAELVMGLYAESQRMAV